MSQGNLTNRSITAAFWGGGGAIGRAVLQLLAQIYLARMIGPDQVGIFAISAMIVGFSYFFSDIGLSFGLIQKEEVTEKDIRFVMFCQYLLAIITGGSLFLFSSWIAEFFNEPRSAAIIASLASIAVLNSLTSVSVNLLKRNLDYKTSNVANLISYFIGYILVGIPLAYFGFGVWSMVVAWVVQAFLFLCFVYNKTRHPLLPLIRHKEGPDMFKYAFVAFSTNIVNWVTGNIDRIFISKNFSASNVAFYTTPYNLVSTAASNLAGIVQPVLFAACSRKQDDIGSQVTALRSILGVMSLVVLPLYFGIAVSAELLILCIYGKGWINAAPVLQALAFGVSAGFLTSMFNPFYWTTGNKTFEAKIQIPNAFLIGLGILIISYLKMGIAAVAWWVSFVMFAKFILSAVVVSKCLRINLKVIFEPLVPSVLLAIAVLLAGYFFNIILTAALGNIGALFLVILGLTIVYFAGLVLLQNMINSDSQVLLNKIFNRLPRSICRFMFILLPSVR